MKTISSIILFAFCTLGLAQTNVSGALSLGTTWSLAKAKILPDLPASILLEGAPRKSKLSWTLSASDNIANYEIYRGLSGRFLKAQNHDYFIKVVVVFFFRN